MSTTTTHPHGRTLKAELDRKWKKIERQRARMLNPKTASRAFLDAVRAKVAYWQGEHARGTDANQCIEGVAFSFLVMIDGCCIGQPGYSVRPLHESGRPGPEVADAGDLHHRLHKPKAKVKS